MCTKNPFYFVQKKSVCKKKGTTYLPLFNVDHIGMKSFLKDHSNFPTPSFSQDINNNKTSRDK